MSFDLLVRNLWTDSGVSGGLAKLNNDLDKLGRSGPGARTGLRLAETGMRTLAFEAAGVQGPLGRVAAGLLSLGGGNALVIGAAAGIGVVAAAYNLFTAGAKEAAKAHEDFLKGLEATGPAGKALAARMNLIAAQDKLTAMEARQARAVTAGKIFAGGLVSLGGYNPKQLEDQRQEVARLSNVAATAEGDLSDAANKAIQTLSRQGDVLAATVRIRTHAVAVGQEESRTLEQIARATAELTAATMGLGTSQTAALVNASVRVERLKEENRTLEAQRDLLKELDQINADVAGFFATPFALQNLAALKVPTLQDLLAQEGSRQAGLQTATVEKQGGEFAFQNFDSTFFANVQAGVDDALAKTPGFKGGGLVMAQAFVTAVGQFAQGGTPGIFGGVGSLLTGASQVTAFSSAAGVLGPAGFIASAFGSIFSVFDHSAAQRHREALAELTRIRQNTDKRGQPDHISVTVLVNGKEVTGAILQDVMYGIRRAERTNAVPVLPPSGG